MSRPQSQARFGWQDRTTQANTFTQKQILSVDNQALTFSGTSSFVGREDTTGLLVVGSGTAWSYTTGAYLLMYGADHATYPGNVALRAGNNGTPGVVQVLDGSGIISLTTASHGADVPDLLRVQGVGPPTSGAGLEISYQSASGYLKAYDRDTSSFQPMYLDGSAVYLRVSGVNRFSLTATQAQFTGSASMNLFVNAQTGSNAGLYFTENAVNKCLAFHDQSGNNFVLRKYLDSDGTTIRSQVIMSDSLDVILRNGATSSYDLVSSTGDVTKNGKSIRTYAGQISSSGSMNFGPTGWTVSKTATGTYRLVHGLGTTSIALVGISTWNSPFDVQCTTIDSNTIDVYVRNSTTGANADSAVNFLAQVV